MGPMAPSGNSVTNNIIQHQQHIHIPQGQQRILHRPGISDRNERLLQFPIHKFITNQINIINKIDIMPPMQSINVNSSNNNSKILTHDIEFTRCCLPSGDCLKVNSMIALDEISDRVRVVCNNENCNAGQYMHRECFESWEEIVLLNLKNVGRARSWSDRQRSQNLWTKKGFDLIYKACGCKCGRGYLRKDLEWPGQVISDTLQQSSANNHIKDENSSCSGQRAAINTTNDEVDINKKRKKKHSRNTQKTTLAPQYFSNFYSNSHQLQTEQSYNNQKEEEIGTTTSCSEITNVGDCSSVSNISTNNNPSVGIIGSGLHHHNQEHNQTQHQNVGSKSSIVCTLPNRSTKNVLGLDLHIRASSLSSSSTDSISPQTSRSSEVVESPVQHNRKQAPKVAPGQFLQFQQCQTFPQGGLGDNILDVCLSVNNNTRSDLLMTIDSHQQQDTVIKNGVDALSCIDQQRLVQQKNKEVEIYSERVRSTSGCNGIFSRRLDFSSFNFLPKTRLNSYQVKIEDEGNHGNDETRLFILSSLAQSQMNRVACILCEVPMLVFDRYPLVDGSFFLSPKQHSPNCIEVKYEGRILFLTCVCMGCLDSTAPNRVINCRFCGENWDGSSLVLGTMYAYDIFAAMPCCAERLKCNSCFKLLLHPQQRLNFYSDYSHCITCPYCTTQDAHFVKPLNYCYTRNAVSCNQFSA